MTLHLNLALQLFSASVKGKVARHAMMASVWRVRESRYMENNKQQGTRSALPTAKLKRTNRMPLPCCIRHWGYHTCAQQRGDAFVQRSQYTAKNRAHIMTHEQERSSKLEKCSQNHHDAVPFIHPLPMKNDTPPEIPEHSKNTPLKVLSNTDNEQNKPSTATVRRDPIVIPYGPGIISDVESDDEATSTASNIETKSVKGNKITDKVKEPSRQVLPSSIIELKVPLIERRRKLWIERSSVCGSEILNPDEELLPNFEPFLELVEPENLPALFDQETCFRSFAYFDRLLSRQNYLKEQRRNAHTGNSHKIETVEDLVEVVNSQPENRVHLPDISPPLVAGKPDELFQDRNRTRVTPQPDVKPTVGYKKVSTSSKNIPPGNMPHSYVEKTKTLLEPKQKKSEVEAGRLRSENVNKKEIGLNVKIPDILHKQIAERKRNGVCCRLTYMPNKRYPKKSSSKYEHFKISAESTFTKQHQNVDTMVSFSTENNISKMSI